MKNTKSSGNATIWIQGGACRVLAGAAIALLSAFSARAGLLYEPSNYAAQDNLVVNLDGIRNAGPHQAHDATAETWKNIGRVANNATFTAKSGDASAWVADGYHFAGGAYGKLTFKQNLGNSMTVQVVADVKGEECSTSWPSFFGCKEDWANLYFSNRNTGLVHFKADAVTGLSSGTRASVTCGANVKYINAALESSTHKQIVTTAASFATGWKEGAGGTQVAPGSLYWYFGSCDGGSGSFDARYLVGTIKAIRVYNKVLSNTELAANRDIDEARFFAGIPVTNVVVGTAVPGLEGNEGGVYAYDENGYTFTAPHKATKDGVDYACTGYTLETWDGEAWSEPVFTASTRYAAKDTSAKVRITWQWRRTSGAKSPDLDPLFDDYVTDGLVLHLDGIRNVGADKPHDSSSPQWIDLVKGNIASFQHDESDASTWKDDGYYFGGRSFAQFVNALSGLTNTVTVQVVCDTTTNALQKLKTAVPDRHVLWPNLVGTGDNDQLNVYYDMNGATRGRLTFKNANGGNAIMVNGADKDAWEGRYVTAIRNGTKNYILQSTAVADAVPVTAATANIAANTLRVGSAGASLNTRNQRWFLGTIKAVRVYDRVLTDAELAQNREIDEARFFGGPMPVENVVVASSVRGVDGNAPAGTYALPAGGFTFSAPASVTVGEDSYSCTGHTLETWDDADGVWGAPVVRDGVLAATISDTSAKVRLTWQWAHTAGPGYDAAFDDYVTDGLVVHLDGIRNTGAQAVHDSGATQWADLARKGGTANLVIETDGCKWMDNGYYFNGTEYGKASYAVMNGKRTLDSAFTVQAVLDFDRNASHRLNVPWPGIVGTTDVKDAFALYYNQNNTGAPGINNKVKNVQSGFGVAPWGGEYINSLFNGTQIAVFETATPAEYKAFSNAPGTRTFTFASGEGGDNRYISRRLTGTIKEIRIFGRALTNAELERNRAADEVRFFGRSPAAAGDLVVASTVEGLSGDQPNGAYRPAAGYAFTSRTEAVLGSVPYELKGYTLETWNGTAWADAETGTGASVVPDVSTSSKRLTWNWAVKSRITKVQTEFDVGDYVQGDLVLHFDGIRNAGAASDHDDGATTWANLGSAGAACNAEFDYPMDGSSATGGWAADGYEFVYGGKFARLLAKPTLDWQVTVQIVCEANGRKNWYPTMFGSTSDYCNLYMRAEGGNEQVAFKPLGNTAVAKGGWGRKYLNGDWHGGMYAVFQTTVPDPSDWTGKWRSEWTVLKDAPFYIGGVYIPNDTTETDRRRFDGKIQSVRVYKRSLSDAELAHNRMVDEARFKGNPPEHNVVVTSRKLPDIEGGETAGCYVVEGVHTFTASALTDPATGETRPVVGYTIETWDENGQTWGAPVFGEGGSYAYAEGAKVRLTWQGRPDAFTIVVR